MKKIILVSILSLSMSNMGFAASSSDSNVCKYLSLNGKGSHFTTSDNTMNAALWYNSKGGDGISGGFGAIVDEAHLDAPLFDSHCYNDGTVVLNWNKIGFSGSLQGKIDLSTHSINVSGTINDKPVTDTLVFIGYH